MLHFGKIPKKIGQILAKVSKIQAKFRQNLKKLFKKSAKMSAIFNEKIKIRERSKTVQRSALCRSQRELSNEYLLAKVGFDGWMDG